jgi:hypothetical protein
MLVIVFTHNYNSDLQNSAVDGYNYSLFFERTSVKIWARAPTILNYMFRVFLVL